MSWGREQRLEFIEFRLFWEGGINRADLVEKFDISVPQASKDLSQYQELAPGNIRYDRSQKRYLAETDFTLRFLEPDPYVYLTQLRSLTEGKAHIAETWIGALPRADASVLPRRDIDLGTLRAILHAVREGQSIEILYQSMNPKHPEATWRRITPHAFGFDGNRWHARAFCHIEGAFKDFLLPRTLQTGAVGAPGPGGNSDWYWHNYFEIELAPHPKLTESQKVVVSKDYGFENGRGVISVRYAMLFYTAKSLGLLEDAMSKDPRRQHIVALNQTAMDAALESSEAGLVKSTDILDGARTA